MRTKLTIIILSLAAILLVSGCTQEEQVACTLDAKICPDGTAVGRDPENNCEFYPCPELVGGNCGTVSPDYRDKCCRDKHKDDPAPIRCPGTWIYDMELGDCRYDCYSNIFEECDALNPCEVGDCVSLAGSAYCVNEDPCEFIYCEEDEECVVLKSYPLQLMCSPRV